MNFSKNRVIIKSNSSFQFNILVGFNNCVTDELGKIEDVLMNLQNVNLCMKIIHSSKHIEFVFDEIQMMHKSYFKGKNKKAWNKLEYKFVCLLSLLDPYLAILKSCSSKEIFEDITHSIFDKCDEYQFGYMCRNILQHKGFVRIYVNDDGIPYIDKDSLIEDYELKLKEEKLLQRCPNDIEALKFINNFVMSLLEMQEWFFYKIYDPNCHKWYQEHIDAKMHKTWYAIYDDSSISEVNVEILNPLAFRPNNKYLEHLTVNQRLLSEKITYKNYLYY